MIIKLKPLLISIAVSLGVGALASLFTMNSMNIYQTIVRPFLSPPSFLFPIAWTILYILMGISAYLIYISDNENKWTALRIYAIQLFFNFVWSLIFFNARMYLFAFIWLVILWALILVMINEFYKVNPLAAYLQIPYFLWVGFAGYLNFMIYLLNR